MPSPDDIEFTPHPNAVDNLEYTTVVADAEKLEQQWSRDRGYYIPPEGGGGPNYVNM